MSAVICALQPVIEDEQQRADVYYQLIDAFTDLDWDTENECLGMDPAFDAALHKFAADHGWDIEDQDDENGIWDDEDNTE